MNWITVYQLKLSVAAASTSIIKTERHKVATAVFVSVPVCIASVNILRKISRVCPESFYFVGDKPTLVHCWFQLHKNVFKGSTHHKAAGRSCTSSLSVSLRCAFCSQWLYALDTARPKTHKHRSLPTLQSDFHPLYGQGIPLSPCQLALLTVASSEDRALV